MVHESADLFFPTQIPDLDNFVCTSSSKPFPAIRGSSDSLDARYMCGEHKDRLQLEFVAIFGLVERDRSVKAVEQFFVGPSDYLEGGWEDSVI